MSHTQAQARRGQVSWCRSVRVSVSCAWQATSVCCPLMGTISSDSLLVSPEGCFHSRARVRAKLQG
eukprot:8896125-Pyramimonas_sp.AAC.1